MKRPLALVLLALFVIADVVLIGIAVDSVRADPPASDISAAKAEAAAGSTQGDDDSSDQVVFEFDAASAGTLSVADDGTLVTGVRGSCRRGESALRTSADGGRKLVDRDPGLRTILAVRAQDGGRITVVGTRDDCTPLQRTSTDGGATWTDDANISLWYPSPSTTRTIVTPKHTSGPSLCTVVSLSQVDGDFGRVVCSDGRLYGTGDAGGKWLTLGRLDNARVITFPTFNRGYALARYQGCAATFFSTEDSGRTWKPGGCITGDPARALSVNDTAVNAVVGTATSIYVSKDQGEQFSQP